MTNNFLYTNLGTRLFGAAGMAIAVSSQYMRMVYLAHGQGDLIDQSLFLNVGPHIGLPMAGSAFFNEDEYMPRLNALYATTIVLSVFELGEFAIGKGQVEDLVANCVGPAILLLAWKVAGSDRLRRFYTGARNNLEDRIAQHKSHYSQE